MCACISSAIFRFHAYDHGLDSNYYTNLSCVKSYKCMKQNDIAVWRVICARR